MGRAKEIIVKVIPAKIANIFIKKHHYSGKVVPNSTLHFGAFLDGKLHGVMSYGPSMKKEGVIKLVEGTGWNEFIELNRMAFDDYLPRNAESHCIAKSIRLIKKNAPQIKWIISFADGTQCGDGTIYRASNFVLTDIRRNTQIRVNPETGEKLHTMTAYHRMIKDFKSWDAMDGYQLRYVYFIDPKYRKRLTVPEIPFSMIDEMGAGMYKGEKITQAERHAIKTN
ncbi:hypothetical protein [Leyella stercorea]|uniref:Mom family adenine methylcarbamoylation protein n=1 Tax=Leyella stercorea TaxID=363265 RepID=UPI00242C141E|nr:hypothetical protein [Leyella stercorea]